MGVYHRMPLVLLFLVALLFTVSCNEQSGRGIFKAENDVEFDTISRVAREYLDGDTLNPYCNIEVDFIYPVGGGKMDLDVMQQFFIRNTFGVAYDTLAPSDAVQEYVQNYIRNYIADAKMYRESSDEIQKLNSMISGVDMADREHYREDLFYSYYESLSDSIVYNRHGVLAFQVKQSNNKGGAASYDSYRNYVLNLHSGSQVTENDIFKAGYDVALQQLIITSLLDQTHVKSVDELEDIGYFGVREIVPNRNFLLNERGIIYTYNKGEYSAYQLDAPQVFIPYEAIFSLLRENGVASKLANLK